MPRLCCWLSRGLREAATSKRAHKDSRSEQWLAGVHSGSQGDPEIGQNGPVDSFRLYRERRHRKCSEKKAPLSQELVRRQNAGRFGFPFRTNLHSRLSNGNPLKGQHGLPAGPPGKACGDRGKD
jgi:hypothetical protein